MFGEERHLQTIIEAEKLEKQFQEKMEIAKKNGDDIAQVVKDYKETQEHLEERFTAPFKVTCLSTTG